MRTYVSIYIFVSLKISPYINLYLFFYYFSLFRLLNIPEVDSFSTSEAKVFATPEPSVSDTMPCTTEMLGLVRTSVTNLTADRSSSRNVLRIFQFLLCGLCAAIGISIYFKSTGVMHDSIICSTTVTLNYIHQTDGKK